MGNPRRRVSTLLDESLYRKAKLEALRQGRQVSEIFGDALASYLHAAADQRGAGVVAETWGTIRVDDDTFRQLMEEPGWLDSRA